MKINSILTICTTVVLTMNTALVSAQTKTIANTELQNGSGMFFSASMDNGTSEITMTIQGPDDRWISVGFGLVMSSADVLTYTDGKAGAMHALDVWDYNMNSQDATGVTKDAQQDWTIVSNTVATGVRTIIATRALNTGDGFDAILNYTDATINVIWAKGSQAGNTLAYHGAGNRGFAVLTWMDPSASIVELINPFILDVKNDELFIIDQSGLDYNFKLVNMSGQIVFEKNNTVGNVQLDISKLSTGMIILQVVNENGEFTQKIALN